MSTIKAIFEKLIEIIPKECPHCGTDLTNLADWGDADRANRTNNEPASRADNSRLRRLAYAEGFPVPQATLEEIERKARERWFRLGYLLGKQETERTTKEER